MIETFISAAIVILIVVVVVICLWWRFLYLMLERYDDEGAVEEGGYSDGFKSKERRSR